MPQWAGKTHKTEEAPAGDGKDAAVPCSVVLPLTYQVILRQAARSTIGGSVYFSLSKGIGVPVEGVDLGGVSRLQELQLHPQRAGHDLHGL
jgi:hypothetical protein